MDRHVLRLAVMAIVLLTSFGMGIVPPAAQAQSPRTSLTIHSRFCPPNYDMSDIYNDCHDTIDTRGIWFSVESPASRARAVNLPDEQGNILVEDLHAETYTMTSSLREADAVFAVYCSSGDGSNGHWVDHQPTEYGWGFYDVPLAPGEAVTCDWYTIPNADYLSTRANIAIRDRFCPVGFSDFGSEWRDCLGTRGMNVIEYRADGPTPMEAWQGQGNIAFTWLKPGTYSISSNIGNYWMVDGAVYCSTWETAGEPFLNQQTDPFGAITLTVNPGDDVICDWYHYPSAEIYQKGAETRLTVVACDEPTVFSREINGSCPQFYGIHLTVYPTYESQFTQTCVYDDGSSCVFSLPYHLPLTVEIDERDVPEGWEPLCNPCTWQTAGEWNGFVVQINPIDG